MVSVKVPSLNRQKIPDLRFRRHNSTDLLRSSATHLCLHARDNTPVASSCCQCNHTEQLKCSRDRPLLKRRLKLLWCLAICSKTLKWIAFVRLLVRRWNTRDLPRITRHSSHPFKLQKGSLWGLGSRFRSSPWGLRCMTTKQFGSLLLKECQTRKRACIRLHR